MLWVYYFCLHFWLSDGRIVPWDRIKPGTLPRGFPGIDAMVDGYKSTTSRTTMDLENMWLDDFETLPEPKHGKNVETIKFVSTFITHS